MKHPGNIAAAICCLLGSCALAWWGAASTEHRQHTAIASDAVRDATGSIIPRAAYRRIACASTIAAEIVPELVSADRVVLVPSWFTKANPRAFRLDLRDADGEARVRSSDIYAGIESLIDIRADIIFINSLSSGGSEQTQRLRDLGLVVCDLGEIRGLETLLPSIRLIGAVLDQPERAELLAAGIERRLRQTAIHIPHDQRQTALYLGTMGGSLIGGTEGSSYHDLLRFGGLIDAAAGRGLSPWPSYDPEQVLAIDPQVIVTEQGRAPALRAIPGFDRLQAVRNDRIIEMPPSTETAGLGLLPAAEFLCDAVYPPP